MNLLYKCITNLRKLYCAILEIFKCTILNTFCQNWSMVEHLHMLPPSPSKLFAKPEIVLADVALLF